MFSRAEGSTRLLIAHHAEDAPRRRRASRSGRSAERRRGRRWQRRRPRCWHTRRVTCEPSNPTPSFPQSFQERQERREEARQALAKASNALLADPKGKP